MHPTRSSATCVGCIRARLAGDRCTHVSVGADPFAVQAVEARACNDGCPQQGDKRGDLAEHHEPERQGPKQVRIGGMVPPRRSRPCAWPVCQRDKPLSGTRAAPAKASRNRGSRIGSQPSPRVIAPANAVMDTAVASVTSRLGTSADRPRVTMSRITMNTTAAIADEGVDVQALGAWADNHDHAEEPDADGGPTTPADRLAQKQGRRQRHAQRRKLHNGSRVGQRHVEQAPSGTARSRRSRPPFATRPVARRCHGAGRRNAPKPQGHGKDQNRGQQPAQKRSPGTAARLRRPSSSVHR